ncbi:MAG: polysaccharide pyruvyl transferase family protein [Oceanipulchritudo sp.]
MKEPRILLRTGWATLNIGDIGHTPGTLRLLYERFPRARITVWSNNLNAGIEAMLRRRFPRVECVSGHLHDKEKGPPRELAAAIDQADLFLFNSGMLLNYGFFGYDWNGPVYNLAPLWRCIEQGIPFGIYGQSFDGFAYPSVSLFKPVLDQAAFIFTRETPSAAYLRELGIACPRIEFGPDGCFGIDVRDEARAETWLNAHGLERDAFLAVNIRTNTPVSADSSTPLNPADPTPEQRAESARWLNTCATVMTRWIRETGLKVLVAPEAFKEIAAARDFLLPLLPADVRDRVVLRDTWWNADEALSTIARARAAFGVEPHSLIMALSAGVPVVHARPLRHGRKGWMFDDIGLGDWLFDIDAAPADAVADMVIAQHTRHQEARARAATAMECVRGRQGATLDAIAETLA